MKINNLVKNYFLNYYTLLCTTQKSEEVKHPPETKNYLSKSNNSNNYHKPFSTASNFKVKNSLEKNTPINNSIRLINS